VPLLSVNGTQIFFRAVPPRWCKLRSHLVVMPVNVNNSVLKNRLTSTCGCGKVETGLFLCSRLQHIDLLQVTVWLEKV
jgi:hypothetical protein